MNVLDFGFDGIAIHTGHVQCYKLEPFSTKLSNLLTHYAVILVTGCIIGGKYYCSELPLWQSGAAALIVFLLVRLRLPVSNV